MRRIIVRRSERRVDRQRRRRHAATELDMRSFQASRAALGRASMRAVAQAAHPAA